MFPSVRANFDPPPPPFISPFSHPLATGLFFESLFFADLRRLPSRSHGQTVPATVVAND